MKYKTHFKAYLLLLVCLFALNSCNLVELDEVPTPDLEVPMGIPSTIDGFIFALASNDSWTWKTLGFRLEGLNGFQSCRLDDTFKFFANGTYRYDGGTVLCGGADDRRIKTGVWEVDLTNNQIVFDRETNIEYSASVLGLNNDRIQLISEVDIFGRAMKIEGIYEVDISN
jgi:hypothetical protein